MAIPVDTVWEVDNGATGASDANGGGFSAANKGATGVDMTYGATAQIVTFSANLSGAGTTTLTCSSALFVNTMLGNVINIAGQGAYCITGFTSATKVVVDRALGTFSGATGVVGGAHLTPAYTCGLMVAGNGLWLKAGSNYSITVNTANVSNGRLVLPYSGGNMFPWMRGYGTSRGDDGTRPVISLGVDLTTSFAAIQLGAAGPGQGVYCDNIECNGQYRTTINGLFSLGQCYNCVARNTASVGFRDCLCLRCHAYDAGFNGLAAVNCIAEGSNGVFQGYGSITCINCIAKPTNAAYGFQGAPATRGALINCVCIGGGFSGAGSGTGNFTFANCISVNAAQYAFYAVGATTRLMNCASYNPTSGRLNGTLLADVNPIILTGDPFTDSANGDYSLNSIAGDACRSAGFFGLPDLPNTVGAPDIGCVPMGVTAADKAAIAALILATPANKIATDANGNVGLPDGHITAAKAPNLDASVSGVPAAVRSNLATELGRVDAAVSSRLASSAYVIPDNASIGAAAATVASNLDAPVSSRSAPGDAMTLTAGERTGLVAAFWGALTSGLTGVGSVGAWLLDKLAAVKAKTDLLGTVHVTVTSPTTEKGNVRIVKATDYTGSLALSFSSSQWPDLSGAKVNLVFPDGKRTPVLTGTEVTLATRGEGVAMPDPQTFSFPLTAAQTTTLDTCRAATWILSATLADSRVVDLKRLIVEVVN